MYTQAYLCRERKGVHEEEIEEQIRIVLFEKMLLHVCKFNSLI